MNDTPQTVDQSRLVEDMTSEQCWEMLRTHEFARLAFHLGPEVHLVPINYTVGNRTLLFRTAPGTKLGGVLMNPDVVLEIDEFDQTRARSVVVRGIARRLEDERLHQIDRIPLRPWLTAPRYDVIEIVPDEITGRAFVLDA